MRRQSAFKRNKKYVMMKDFDILASNRAEEHLLYMEANYEKGIEMMAPTYVRNTKGQKYSFCVPIEQFQQFGPGMYLLFLFLKYCTLLFLVLSIISFVNLGVLTQGSQLNPNYINFQAQMAKTTLGNVQPNELGVIVVFDFIMTVIILFSLIYWKEKESSFVVDCCKQVMLPSYQTVVLKEIPELYTQYDMKVFLQQRFGQVEDIYTVRNFRNDLYHYKKITEMIKQYKQQRALIRLKPERSTVKLAKIFLDFQKSYFYMQQQSKLLKYPKQFAYITFKSVKSREEMLKLYKRTMPEMDEEDRQYFLYKSQELKVRACLMEPNGIIWENLNLPKKKTFMWVVLQIFLLTLMLVISIIVIFILYMSESGLASNEFAGMTKEQILALHSPQALQSYCLTLSFSDFNSDPDCQSHQSPYVKSTILFVALPLIMALFKFVLTELMKALVGIRRHPYQIKKIESQIIIMFVFYFFATGILQYIVFLQVNFDDGSSFSFVSIMKPLQTALVGYLDIDTSKIRLANDYNRYWYMLASYKIIIIALASFNVSSIGKIAYSFLRDFVCKFYARKQVLQCRMNYWLEGEHMQIEFVYAVAGTMIGYLLLFGTAIPLVYPLICVSFFILFWSTKIIFINYCAKPLLYSHSMNSLMVKLLMGCVIIHCFVAPLYFGAASIYSQEGIRNFLRIPYFGYYIAVMAIAIIYLVYRQRLGNFYEKAKYFYNYNYSNSNQEINEIAPRRLNKMSLPSKLCLIEPPQAFIENTTFSYSMHQNPDYQSILITLYTINKQERARATCVLNKELENLLERDENFAADTLHDIGGDPLPENMTKPKLFYELLQMTEKNKNKFQKRVGKDYSKSNNPYKFYLRELSEIDKASKTIEHDLESEEVIEPTGFQSVSLRSVRVQNLTEDQHINQRYLQKIQNLRRRFKPQPNLREILQRSDQQSKSRNLGSSMAEDEQPKSDARLRSSLYLGVTSNINGNQQVSNLGINSQFNIPNRSSIKRSDQNLKENFDDKFDCIKQTQSIIQANKLNHNDPERDQAKKKNLFKKQQENEVKRKTSIKDKHSSSSKPKRTSFEPILSNNEPDGRPIGKQINHNQTNKHSKKGSEQNKISIPSIPNIPNIPNKKVNNNFLKIDRMQAHGNAKNQQVKDTQHNYSKGVQNRKSLVQNYKKMKQKYSQNRSPSKDQKNVVSENQILTSQGEMDTLKVPKP